MTDADLPPTVQRISAVMPEWRTARPSLRILLVVHSLTAATRLGDLVPIFRDPRIQLFCVRTSGAVFANGVEKFIDSHEIYELSWKQAANMQFHAAVTASLGDDLHEIKCRILRIAHGNGYNKHWNNGTTEQRNNGTTEQRNNGTTEQRNNGTVFGLSAETLEHEGRLVPAAIGLSHDEQFARLAEGCSDALPAAFLAGDPCHDRMLASLPRRLHYRSALGLRPGQRLVTVASTWREDSLFGIDPLFASRLLGELPFDLYRVALVLHPNIWASHSAFQIRAWLAEALRAGLVLLPPEEGWRAAVIAADWVLSDHGPVGVYAAAAGRPVLLEQSGRKTVDPRSGLGRLFEVAAPLDPHDALEPQLRRAEELRERTHALAAASVSSAPGRSLRLIRERLYALMGEAPPGTDPAVLAVDAPTADGAAPASLWTGVEPTGPRELSVRRWPAAVAGPGAGVLIVADHELDHRLAGAADVIWTMRDALPSDEATWSASVFEHRPGLTLTLVQDGRHATLRTRSGRRTEVSLTGPEASDLVFAVLAERRVSGTRDLAALSPLTLRLGQGLTVEAAFSATSP